jgi:hypothetical protein
MMIRKHLGRIQKVAFGFGGYDDAMIGLSFRLGGPAWSVDVFRGAWATHSERCQWTLEDQTAKFAETVILLRDTLRAAKRMHVAELVGTPVEVTLDGNKLISWRVLEEVI